jgi:archaellum biogenesis ATPase FlaH
MDLKKIIDNNQIILFVISPKEYLEFIKNFIRFFITSKLSCYVTLNRPYVSLNKFLESAKIDIDSMFFIDTSTKMSSIASPDADNCIFIESPSALTSLSIAVTEIVNNSNPEYVLFDSLSTLSIYNPENAIIKFTNDLINKTRASESKLILISIGSGEGDKVIEKVSMFTDYVEYI